MRATTPSSKVLLLGAALAGVTPGSLWAQQARPNLPSPQLGQDVTVTGTAPADLENLPEGPEVDGFISRTQG